MDRSVFNEIREKKIMVSMSLEKYTNMHFPL